MELHYWQVSEYLFKNETALNEMLEAIVLALMKCQEEKRRYLLFQGGHILRQADVFQI